MIAKPLIISSEDKTIAEAQEAIGGFDIVKNADIFAEQLSELFLVSNPKARLEPDFASQVKGFVDRRLASGDYGCYVYFPWSKTMVHMVSAAEYFTLRTNRNQNLITRAEQQKLFDATVAIAGMSIGGNMAVNFAYSAFASRMALADFDKLETTNLNRIRAKLEDVGKPKTDIAAAAIYEINPFAELKVIEDGLSSSNLEQFILKPRPQAIFDAIDDFEMKIRIRLAAKQHQVPVIMLTNLGDNVMIDIERYDQDPDLALFNGLIGDLAGDILLGSVTEADKKRYAVELVGKQNIPERAIQSVAEINNTLVGRPQLQSTVITASGLAPLIFRMIVLGEDLPSGRRVLRLNELIHV